MFSADGQALGRFGGRDADTPGKYQTLKGLRFALEHALEQHRKLPVRKVEPRKDEASAPRLPEDYAAARRFPQRSCIHCHHVHEWQRADAQASGAWSKRWEWKYPDPSQIGVSLDLDQQNRITSVAETSWAHKAGLNKGDELVRINGLPVASIADLQFALDRAPHVGAVGIDYRRAGKLHQTSLRLPPLWKQGDVSWRWSLKSLKPDPPFGGDDLTALEKTALGIPPELMAFRVGNFLPRVAQQAGFKVNDVVVGLEDHADSTLSFRQFEAHFRMSYKSGDMPSFQVLRDGKKVAISFRVP